MLTKEAYFKKRNNLLSEAEELLNAGDLEGYEAKEEEVNALDDEFENVSKAQANMNALKNKVAQKNNLIGDTEPTSDEGIEDKENFYSSKKYRKAFMNFVKTGEMPDKMMVNADQTTKTSDAGAVIPETIMQEIIKEMEEYGQIFDRVRKLNIQGGVDVPISSLKPTAQWIDEDNVSDRQKADLSNKVSFSYYGLECRIAASLLSNVTTLDIFEQELINLVTEAMVKAMDKAVITGSGSGQPLGILNDDRVPNDNIITLSESEFSEWESWKKKVMAKIPLAYRAGGSWIMAAGTFEGQIDGMVDANGQPVGRTNRGITDAPQERFDGREVILVEDDVITPYSAASVDDEVVLYCDLSEYAINSNMQMTMYRWMDHDKNEWVDKAILIADGKILDPHGVIIVKKGA